jgi:hypothetical protein
MVPLKILGMPKNMQLAGNFVKTEPILISLLLIPEMLFSKTPTIKLWYPSAEIYFQVGSTERIIMIPGILSD